jgi:hypothetical protein
MTPIFGGGFAASAKPTFGEWLPQACRYLGPPGSMRPPLQGAPGSN